MPKTTKIKLSKQELMHETGIDAHMTDLQRAEAWQYWLTTKPPMTLVRKMKRALDDFPWGQS